MKKISYILSTSLLLLLQSLTFAQSFSPEQIQAFEEAKRKRVAEIHAQAANGNANANKILITGPEQDCQNAIIVSQATYIQPNSYEGDGAIHSEVDSLNSCLATSEQNGVWYKFTPYASGSIGFEIVPFNLSDDYDWAVYDLTNATCADIATNPSLEISCNFSGITGTTGPNGMTGMQYGSLINVTAGSTYAILINNFSSTQSGYTLNFTANTFALFANYKGVVYNDANNDCIKNPNEGQVPYNIMGFGLPNGNTIYGNSNASGAYHFTYDTGVYQLHVFPPNYYTASCPSTGILSAHVGAYGDSTFNNFAIQPIANNINDLRTNVTFGGLPVTGQLKNIYVAAQNVGTSTLNATIAFQLDSYLTDSLVSPTPDSIVGNTYYWNTIIPPFVNQTFTVLCRIPTTLMLGTPLLNVATIYPVVGDTTTNDNIDSLQNVVVAPYDPNMIIVNREKVLEVDADAGTYLTYTIYFQNLGTYYAENVIVKDSLPAKLSMSSIEMLASSHPCTWELYGENAIKFKFLAINLPWEAQNEPESHGFVKFRIKTEGDFNYLEEIKNKAYIYFDYNPAIITNDAITVIEKELTENETAKEEALGISLYPNPLTDVLHLKMNEISYEKIQISFLTMSGQEIYQTSLQANQKELLVKIDRNALTSGMYLIRYKVGARYGYTKMVVE